MKTLASILGGVISILLIGLNSANAEMKTLGENVYMHFSSGYTSLVVVGEEGALVVDHAWADRANIIKADIAEVTDMPVTHVVLTHDHYDHVGGSEVFEGAEVVCHTTCQKIFDLDELGLAPKKVTQSFEDKLTFDLGGKTVELLHVGAGDGVATTIISVPADKVVATADMSDPMSLTNGGYIDDRNYLGVRKILNEISTWDLEHSVSGHSNSTDPGALKAGAEFTNDLYDAVKAELETVMAEGGLGAAYGVLLDGTLAAKIKLPKYESWDGYEEHLPQHVWRMGMALVHGG